MVICYCGDKCKHYLCIGVNLVAILNWNMKDAGAEVRHGVFMGWSF